VLLRSNRIFLRGVMSATLVSLPPPCARVCNGRWFGVDLPQRMPFRNTVRRLWNSFGPQCCVT
jgi:hypothetical protein